MTSHRSTRIPRRLISALATAVVAFAPAVGASARAAAAEKAPAQIEDLSPAGTPGAHRSAGGGITHDKLAFGEATAPEVAGTAVVPETSSLLATYRVTTDDTGDVAGYERVRRYNRSAHQMAISGEAHAARLVFGGDLVAVVSDAPENL